MKIGITYTGSEEKQQYYHQWLQAGADEELELVDLHPSIEGADMHTSAEKQRPPDLAEQPNHNASPEGLNLDTFDGIVFSGGIDVHPSLYNMDIDYANAPQTFNPARDKFEKWLFEEAMTRRIPVLGICRGMQLINVLSGGTLKQDLGLDGNAKHRAEPTDKSHHAEVLPDNMLAEIIQGSGAIRINSAHHQVIDKPGNNLLVTCRSDDGHPEAIEWINKENRSFLLCVQWHPERMFRFNLADTAASAGLRKRFLDEVKSYMAE